ncbi:YdjY domain-containing protein [Peptostreptococcus faecalis]|uniref:YdjY domain-containing protein n=1 Tax=Peptostreptococcus faecalis TaxID=2045015 RepID=UPI000C7C2639|nr:YdjY domain-containing protein [Peptostreptococcus faecalis]
MKLRKQLLASLLCLSLVGAVGCTQKDSSDSSNSNKQEQKAADEVAGVSLKNPIKVDKEAKTVTILSRVNGKYFTEPTRHASVFKEGSNGEKSIFTAYADHVAFHKGLVEIGAKAGENMTPDNATKTKVEGSTIKAEVTWDGADKAYDINEVVKDSNNTKIDFKFGGNLERAKEKNTGCLTCLDSCPVGIISNAAYTYGSVENTKEVGFTGNDKILPEDGTYVAVVYTLQD